MSHNIHKQNKTAKIRAERILTVINEVRVTGLEPAHHSALEPKSNVSANFTTPAYKIPPPMCTEGDK